MTMARKLARTERIVEDIDLIGLVSWGQAVAIATAIAGPAAAEALIGQMLAARQLCRVGNFLEVA